MIDKYKFEEFNMQSFLDFILDLINNFGMGEIRFNPHSGKNLFDKYQMEHIAPNNDIHNPRGFLGIWNKNIDNVRIVSFELFNRNGTPSISVTINLDKKIISLNEAQGIKKESIVELLRNHFLIDSIRGDVVHVNKWWKYLHPVWWVWFVTLLVFKDGIWTLFKLAWKHKIISVIVLAIIIPIVVGLCINYLTYKFGWNNVIK